MAISPEAVTVELLAENPSLMAAVGLMRWQEWGNEPGSEAQASWTAVTAREAGRDSLPITWVAVDRHGEALGAVALAAYDIDERRDRTPWLVGMIVRADVRGQGIGGQLVAHLEAWARHAGYTRLWVATGGRAVAFYQKCGWQWSETFVRAEGDETTVLTRLL